APIGGHHVVAEAARHAFEQAALHRVVIDDQNEFGHGDSAATVPIWGAPWRSGLNALLSVGSPPALLNRAAPRLCCGDHSRDPMPTAAGKKTAAKPAKSATRKPA